jgi:alkanesulfonate monooxygenase SsuD/methylene tetrahydromethanopterin reductase-like flavin-dependent oxidoreductase (luciferase family)
VTSAPRGRVGIPSGHLAFAEDIRRRLRAAGRPEDDLRILPGTETIIGATEEEAREKARWIRLEQVTPATKPRP